MDELVEFNLGPTDADADTDADAGVDTLTFKNVEEQPLMSTLQATILATVSLVTLVVGVGVNFRIYRLLARRRSSGSCSAIDKLCLVHSLVSLAGHPPLLVSHGLHSLHSLKWKPLELSAKLFLSRNYIVLKCSITRPLNPILTVKPFFLLAIGWQKEPFLTLFDSCDVSLKDAAGLQFYALVHCQKFD